MVHIEDPPVSTASSAAYMVCVVVCSLYFLTAGTMLYNPAPNICTSGTTYGYFMVPSMGPPGTTYGYFPVPSDHGRSNS